MVQEPRVGAWHRHGPSAGDYMTGVLAKVRRPPEFLWPGVHDEHPLCASSDGIVFDCRAGVFRLSCAITTGIRSAHNRDSGIGDDDRRQVPFRQRLRHFPGNRPVDSRIGVELLAPQAQAWDR